MNRLTQKYSSKLVAGVAGASVALMSAVALAATGDSPQSEDTTVTIIIPEKVSILRLDDIDFGTWDLVGAEQGTDSLCVWTNAGGGYTVQITSDTTGYTLENAGTATSLPFTVEWANTAGATSGTTVPYNTATGFNLSAPTTPDCNAGTNSTLIIDIAEADLAAAEADAAAYQAVLTVEIAAVP